MFFFLIKYKLLQETACSCKILCAREKFFLICIYVFRARIVSANTKVTKDWNVRALKRIELALVGSLRL